MVANKTRFKNPLPINTSLIKKGKLYSILSQDKKIYPLRLRLLQASIVSIITIAGVIILRGFLPPQLPLFYGLPKGEQQLTSSINLVIPSLISLGIIVINYSLSTLLEDDFLKKALVLTAIVCVFFSTITTIKIFFLVGSL